MNKTSEFRELLKGVKAGQRNIACFALAEYYLTQQKQVGYVYRGFLAWNRRNIPPMNQEEVADIVRAALAQYRRSHAP